MPSFISIERVGLWLDDVEDEEDADYASAVAASLVGDDLHTDSTLREQLAQLTAKVAGLRIAVGFRTEEWWREVIAYAGGVPWPGGAPDQAPQTDARAGTRRSAPSYAAYREAAADASRAIEADDVPAMLALLDDARLAPPPASEVRHPHYREARRVETRRSLWRAIVVRRRRELPLARILRAFAEEADEVAHIVAYKLYVQAHLEGELATHSATEDPRVERWVARAIEEWPDFPRERDTAPRAPAPPPRDLLDRLELVLPRLTDEEPNELDALRRALDRASQAGLAEARAAFGSRLTALLAHEHPARVRALAVELLWEMKVSPEELVPHVVGLAPSPVVDKIHEVFRAREEARANPRDLLPEHVSARVTAVTCDASKVEDQEVAAMLLAECRDLAQRRDPFTWFGDIAEAFPEGMLAYADDNGRTYHAHRGKLAWGRKRVTAADLARDDLRKRSSVGEPPVPDEYLAFAEQRAAVERAVAVNEGPNEAAWTALAHPALNAARGPLKKLGDTVRIEAYESLARAPRPVPLALALDAVLRERHIGFRVALALRGRSDLQPRFGAMLRSASSARARESLRKILGNAADSFEVRVAPSPEQTQAEQGPEPSIHDAIDQALARAESSTLGVPGPKRRSPKDNAAFKEAEALAKEAERTGEVSAILAVLERPELASERGNATRASLWQKLVSTKRKTLPFVRILRALAEEVDEVVRGIGYRLYVQKHLEGALLEAALDGWSREPKLDRLIARIAYCAQEWPDFTIPETVPPALAKRLRPR